MKTKIMRWPVLGVAFGIGLLMAWEPHPAVAMGEGEALGGLIELSFDLSSTTTEIMLWKDKQDEEKERDEKKKGAETPSATQREYLRREGENLAQEAAQGGGERLVVVAEWMGCPAKIHPAFFRAIQAKQPGLFFSGANPDATWAGIRETVRQTPELAARCQAP
ncbi:MAG: DUF3015 domain-containing protein [Deltaproteobacteria bacterium]|nr:DUF3015 domain-containing protein [Deltaproteobacteria bacterium]